MRKASFLWLGAVLAAAAVAPAEAQSNGEATESATIWDGVYTAAQAERGKDLASTNCSACHAATEWGSASFMSRWGGSSIAHLHVHIRENMPYDSPGRLTAKEYADIIAYMLSLNNVPAGQSELPSTTAELDRIEFTAQAPQAHNH